MLLQLADVLDQAEVSAIVKSLADAASTFSSGKTTAGHHARTVKHNDQSAAPEALAAIAAVQRALLANPLFKAAARPKELVGMLVSRYRPGMAYGTHVDDALMGGKRTDMSFTCFLSDPATYDGGELVIEDHSGDTALKPAAGSIVLYPTTALHHVAEVTKGERLAVVGWVRSYIRDAAQREILFDLDQLASALADNEANRPLLNLALKSRSNLVRMWADD